MDEQTGEIIRGATGAFDDLRGTARLSGDGCPASFSLHQLHVDKELRGAVRVILHLQNLAYVASGGAQGEIARLIQQGEVDVEATVQARRQMTDGTLEATMRALLRRSRHSIPELYHLTRRTDGGRLVAEALNRCGR